MKFMSLIITSHGNKLLYAVCGTMLLKSSIKHYESVVFAKEL